jgi:hypothetical protein
VYVQFDGHDSPVGTPEIESLPLSFTEAQVTQASQQGLIFQHRVHRESSAASLRIVVRDAGTGAIGSLTAPFSQIDK